MSYLLAIDPKQNIVLRPACIHLFPELQALSHDEVLFIVYAFDIHSPLRRYHEADRIRRALLHVFHGTNAKLLPIIEGGDPHHRINVAIRAYKALQYDPKAELVNKYQETIDEIKSSIHAELSDKDLKSKLENVANLRKHVQALEDEIATEMIEEGQLKGDMELSYLENLQKNKELYEYVTTKKGKKPINA